MAQFSKIRLTKHGLEMLAQVQLGASLVFTEVAVGDGYITEETDVLSLTSLISPVSADIAIAENTVMGNGQTRLTARLKSGEDAFFLREIGIYAKINDGAAALYAYANAGDNADYIPAAGGASSVIQDLNLFTVVGNAENVSAVITAEIGIQRGEFETAINKLTAAYSEISRKVDSIGNAYLGDEVAEIYFACYKRRNKGHSEYLYYEIHSDSPGVKLKDGTYTNFTKIFTVSNSSQDVSAAFLGFDPKTVIVKPINEVVMDNTLTAAETIAGTYVKIDLSTLDFEVEETTEYEYSAVAYGTLINN